MRGAWKLLIAAGAITAIWAAAPTTAMAANPTCTGDGTSGKRVQAVYAHVTGQTPVPDAVNLITQWAGETERSFDVSSRKTAPGGFARPRWLFTGPCGQPGSVFDVLEVSIANPGDSFGALRIALGATGPGGTSGATPGTPVANVDRKYMVFLDLTGCGGPTADSWFDTDPDPDTNVSNQNPGTGFNRAMIARYCRGSWENPPGSSTNIGIPHELVHILGGVNQAAPNGAWGHTWDFWEVMSADDTFPFDDGMATDPDTGTVYCVFTCPPDCDTDLEGLDKQLLLDCGNNDYFSMAPPAASYLADNWNLATSCFLVTSGVNDPTPNPADCEADYVPGPGPGPGGGATTPPATEPFDLAAALKKCKKKKSKKARNKCKKRAKQQAQAGAIR